MPQTILVVEDEPNIVESLSFLMKKAGFIVRVARDGNTAIRTIESVCRTIRANPDWDHVRIIMLSAKGRDLDRRKGLELGADDYITKPFSTREIVERVQEILGTKSD
jgi:DNA-binding response OmpR family regulator